MKAQKDGWSTLELTEIIRVNQLVRRHIDLAGFQAWYEELSPSEQCTLIYALFEFAYQAGVDEDVWEQTLDQIHVEDNLALSVLSSLLRRSSRERKLKDWIGLKRWLLNSSDMERLDALKIAVYLFGIAEARVFNNEMKEYCNHWWHRDLLDERVVRAILEDPEYYKTSMKDDDPIKEGADGLKKWITDRLSGLLSRQR